MVLLIDTMRWGSMPEGTVYESNNEATSQAERMVCFPTDLKG